MITRKRQRCEITTMFGVGIVAAFSVVSTATAAVTTTDIPLLALPRLIDSSVAKTAEIRYQAVQEAGVPSSALGKVVGGTEADYGAYPFFVRLRPLLGTSKCGGSLVAPDVVLTAAHCNGNFENFAVSVNGYTASLLNNQDEEETESVEKLPHPDFVLDTFANDYMLLKLKDPIETIEPVTLNFDGAVPGFVEDLRVIGLGTIQEGGQFPNFLREVIVQHADMELCQKAYADAGLNLVREEIMFCAQGDKKDACQGDSGGPIMDLNNVQLGVVSFGLGCARPDFPGVYSRVSAAQQWLTENICALSAFPCDIGSESSVGNEKTEAPIVPETTAPIVLATEAPVVPVTEAPVVPVTQAPVVPVTQAPVVPETDAPVVPDTGAPVEPVTEAPVTESPVTKSPVTGAPVAAEDTPSPSAAPVPSLFPTFATFDMPSEAPSTLPIVGTRFPSFAPFVVPTPSRFPTFFPFELPSSAPSIPVGGQKAGPTPSTGSLAPVAGTTNDTPTGTFAPSYTGGARGPGICDDFLGKTFSMNKGRAPRSCSWLQGQSAADIEEICTAVGSEAYDVCEETCGKCKDTCEDDNNAVFSVFIQDNPEPLFRGCEWVNDRSRIRAMVCVDGHDAYNVCPETCNSCAGEDSVSVKAPADFFLDALEARDRSVGDPRYGDANMEDYLIARIRGENREESNDDEIRDVGGIH